MPKIFSPEKPDDPTDRSVEARQKRTQQIVADTASEFFKALERAHNRLDRYLFSNPEGLTEQQAFDGLGDEAANALALIVKLKEFGADPVRGGIPVKLREMARETEVDPRTGRVTVIIPPEPEPEVEPEPEPIAAVDAFGRPAKAASPVVAKNATTPVTP